MSDRVLVDTNVLVSAFIAGGPPSRVIDEAIDGRIELVLAAPVRDCQILCVNGFVGHVFVAPLLRDGDSVAVVDCEGVEDLLPVVDSPCHVLAVGPSCGGDEVEHLQRCLLVREIPAMADGSTESGV
jgi:hypothetical protein